MLRAMIPARRRLPGTFSRLENDYETFWNPFDRFLKQEDWDMIPQQVFPNVNVAETDDVYEVTAELPGMDVKDVNVEFQNGMLWISGEKKEEKVEKGRTFHRIERNYGKFSRRIDMPGVIKETGIDAEFENGILKVVVPKSQELKPKQIKVKAH
jgi:HSP20 family protein